MIGQSQIPGALRLAGVESIPLGEGLALLALILAQVITDQEMQLLDTMELFIVMTSLLSEPLCSDH